MVAATLDPEPVAATYLGGTDSEGTSVMKTDADGNVYAAGTVRSPNMPTRNAAQSRFGGGDVDLFVGGLAAAAGRES